MHSALDAMGFSSYFENNNQSYQGKDVQLHSGLGDKILEMLKPNVMKSPWIYFIHILAFHRPIRVPDFEKMSISSQLKNSNDAKIIVGYHGSGLVNAILFGNKNLKLIEIFNKYYQNPVFEVMAKNANIKYRKFVCKKSFLNLDCVVNENHFLKYLNL